MLILPAFFTGVVAKVICTISAAATSYVVKEGIKEIFKENSETVCKLFDEMAKGDKIGKGGMF